MTEHDIEINAMDDAWREISETIQRLERSRVWLKGVAPAHEEYVTLLDVISKLREARISLYRKTHGHTE